MAPPTSGGHMTAPAVDMDADMGALRPARPRRASPLPLRTACAPRVDSKNLEPSRPRLESLTRSVAVLGDADLKRWSLTWKMSRSAVLAWAAGKQPHGSLSERQELLGSSVHGALRGLEHAQPLWFTRSVPECDQLQVACTVRDAEDGCSYILRTRHGDTKVTHHVPEPKGVSPSADDPKARLLENNGLGFGFGNLSPATEVFVAAVLRMVSAIDASTSDKEARVPLPSCEPQLLIAEGHVHVTEDDVAEFRTMYTAAQACEIMRREYPLLNATLADATSLVQMRQATLRIVGAILLICATETEGGAPNEYARETMARATELQERCRNAARDLEQLAWACTPIWLTRRPIELCVITCDGCAAVTFWGRAFFSNDVDESQHVHLLAYAHFGNPHLLHYVAQLRTGPAECGLPATQAGTDRRASAWYAAVTAANKARAEEGRELREPPWTSDEAIRAARELLTAPFDAAQPLHAASLAHAERARAAAAAAYAREEYKEAAEAYSYALAVAPWSDAPGATNARAALLSNRAQCALRASMPAAAEADCTASLALRPDDAKTLLRRAQARLQTGDAAGAADDLAAARAPST